MEKTTQPEPCEYASLRQRIAELEEQLAIQKYEIDSLRSQVGSEEDIHDLRDIIQNNADALVVDSEGVVCFVNPAAERLFDRSASELMGNELGIPLVENGKTEVDIYDRQGQRFVAEMRVTRIVWDGKVAYLASFRDITLRKQLEDELEQKIHERTAQLLEVTQQLSIELAERERSEKAILRRDAILEAIEFAAQRFLTNPNIAQELPVVLDRLGTATMVSRAIVFRVISSDSNAKHSQATMPSKTLSVPSMVLGKGYRTIEPVALPNGTDTQGSTGIACQIIAEWFSPFDMHILSPLTHTLSGDFPTEDKKLTIPIRWKERLSRGFSIHGDIRTFPMHERVLFEHREVHSIVAIPIFVDREWWGFIQLEEHQSHKAWSLVEVEALRAAASIIGAALQQEHALAALRSSEELFRTITDVTQDWVYWMNPDGTFRYVTPSCERITGYTPEEWYAHPEYLQTLVHPSDCHLVLDHLRQELDAREPGTFLFRIITRNKEERWIEHTCQPVFDSEGNWLGQRASNRDITTQVQVQESLCREQQLFIQGPVVAMKWVIGDMWRVVYVSPNIAQFGYLPEDLTSEIVCYTSLIHPEDLDRVIAERDAYQQTGIHCFDQDYRIFHADGSVRWVHVFTNMVQHNQNHEIDCDGYMLDITERKQAEEQLRLSEEQFREFVVEIDDLVCQLNHAYEITYINRTAERIFGVSPTECIGVDIFRFIDPSDVVRSRAAFQVWIKSRATSVSFDNRCMSRTGQSFHLLWTINLHYDEQGNMISINAIARDITAYKQVEQMLREGESRYRAISELVSDFAYALHIEPDGKPIIEWATDAFANITGFTPYELETLGGWDTMIFPSDLAMVRQSREWLLEGQQSDEYEFRIITKRGEMRWLRNHCRPVWDKTLHRVARIYGGVQDVTEWKQAMEALQESEQKFHSFFQQSSDGLVLMNNQGYIIEWNQGAEHIWKQTLMDVIGLPLWEIICDLIPESQDHATFQEELENIIRSPCFGKHQDHWITYQIQYPDGKRCSIEMHIFPIHTAKGCLFGAIMHDVTPR